MPAWAAHGFTVTTQAPLASTVTSLGAGHALMSDQTQPSGLLLQYCGQSLPLTEL